MRPSGPIQIKDAGVLLRHGPPMRDDDIIRRIERFPFHRAPVAVEWRGKGYTLFHADTRHPIARLRPYGRDDLMEIFLLVAMERALVPDRPIRKHRRSAQ